MDKILVIGEFSGTGGTRDFFVDLIQYLQNRSCKEQHFYVFSARKELESKVADRLQGENVEFLDRKKIPFFKLRSMGIPGEIIFSFIFFFFTRKKYSVNKVILSVATPGIFISAFLFNWKVSYILHSYPRKKPGKLGMWYSSVVNNFLGPEKRIIVVSKYSRKMLIEHWNITNNHDNILVVYNYANLIEENRHLEQERIIITIGHVIWYKNPFFWIKVAEKVIERCPDSRISFIWAGDGDLLDECRQKVKGNERIRFIGHQDNIQEWLQKAYIYFHPSLIENHSISILNAMSVGVPCIVSNVGGNPESVQHNITGYVVDVNEIEESVEMIVKLLQDEKLAEQVGTSGKMYVNSNFSRDSWEKRMSQLV